MNKYKKIAAIAVTAIMAGSMVASMAACGGDTDTFDASKPVITEFTGYTPYTVLNMNVGNQNDTERQGIKFRDKELSGSVVLADGKTYSSGNLKPAWATLRDKLQISFNDVYTNVGSDQQISDPIIGEGNIRLYDVITGSLTKINEYASNFVNLSKYLDLMPNYKAFLEANPVVMYSLTGNPSGSAMYAAPYFDGLNDIEKYELFNQIWVQDILGTKDTSGVNTKYADNAAAKVTGLTAANFKPSIKPFMGQTGDWTIESTNEQGTGTVTIRVDYAAANTAAKNPVTPLGGAIQAAAGEAYAGDSGNIVDLMNFALEKKPAEVTGGQLTDILRAYVDAAYRTADGNASYYGAERRADVFNGYDAAWDVDLLAALSRCVVSSHSLLSGSTKAATHIYAIAGREPTTQRRVDLTTLAGALYGFRGADCSRYEYAYIGKDGELRDSRSDAKTYEYLDNLSAFAKEGLLYTGDQKNTTYNDSGASTIQAMMIHDYSQTQTKHGLDATIDNVPGETDLTQYNFAPVVTPVSKWDTDDDGEKDTTMRFTESWRSVKNTGFCVPVHVERDTNKLQAVLAFIDYIFSSDGQILMTYGDVANAASNYTNGWWKGTEATGVNIDEVATVTVKENKLPTELDGEGNEVVVNTGKVINYFPNQYTMKPDYVDDYFIYDGKVYTGTPYSGRVVPTMTDNNLTFYKGDVVNKFKQGDSAQAIMKQVGNYTNYARRWIGTTLPIGNKDQGFEYQCTAACALAGMEKVSVALNNGTIKHVKLSVDTANNESMWYLICPTAMPYTNAQRSALTKGEQSKISDTYFRNNSRGPIISNVFIDIIFYGFNETENICGQSTIGTMKMSGQDYVDWINPLALTTRLNIMKAGWAALKNIYDIGGTTSST